MSDSPSTQQPQPQAGDSSTTAASSTNAGQGNDGAAPQPLHLDLDSPDMRSLNETLTGPLSPTTPRAAADAERAMSSTTAWKPSLDRRQSWNREEAKHALHMTGIGEVKSGAAGFTERRD